MSSTCLILHYLLAQARVSTAAPLPPSDDQGPTIPYGNLTALNEAFAPTWLATARRRGTSDLLWSCLITLSLCVYTAIHLNVPSAGRPKWEQYLRKMKWALVGIFAPEIVLFCAWSQWWSSKKLSMELTRLSRERRTQGTELKPANGEVARSDPIGNETLYRAETEEIPNLEEAKYNMVYGFYAVMGGFVVDIGHMHDKYQQFTLTPRGVLMLAGRGHFLRISEQSIRDKSKADVLAKGLVCLQVTWLMVQCIARKLSGYPISLLELHTFIHVICALMMYSLWFKKPLDVNDPTVVDQADFQDILALTLLSCTDIKDRRFENDKGPVQIEASSEREILWLRSDLEEAKEAPPAPLQVLDPIYDKIISRQLQAPTKQTLRTGQTLPNGIGPAYLYRPRVGAKIGPDRKYVSYDLSDPEMGSYPFRIECSRKDIRRWELAALAEVKFRETTKYKSLPDRHLSHMLCRRAYNLPLNSSSSAGNFNPLSPSDLPNQYTLFGVMLLLLSSYGGIHASAWNWEFATRVEQIMWRVSCAELAGAFVIVALAILAGKVAVHLRFHTASNGIFVGHYRNASFLDIFVAVVYCMLKVCRKLTTAFMWLFIAANAPVYLFARVFIVVESFISLRHLPIGVYATVPWSNYIPHL